MNVIELYNNNKDLYTDVRKRINDFVKQGRTKLFNDELEAEKYARENNSSPYMVYNSEMKSVGFAVPK